MELVGRDVEAAAVAGCLAAVAAGERQLLVVSGEAGIGKTRLLSELAADARRRRFHVTEGRATEHESDLPLVLFREAFPALAGQHETGGQDRWRLFTEVGAAWAAHQLPVMTLDDIQWADPASLELTEALVRRPPRRAHLLAVAGRPGAVVDRLLTAARAAARAVTRVELAPLSRAAADQLVGRDRTEDERRRLYESAGGNPLLLLELARAVDPSAVPTNIVAAIAAELAVLEPPARALIDAGALLGDPFDVEVARAIAGLDADTALAAVDELVGRGLVQPTSTLSALAFRHPVVRSAVSEGQNPSLRIRGHRRAAEVLAAAGSPLTERARHLAPTAAPGEIETAAVLRAAARLVAGRAPTIAADWLVAAKRAVPPTEPEEFSELAEALVRAGRIGEALPVADEGLVFAHGTPADTTRLVLAAAAVERLLGRHEASRRRLVRALDRVAGPRTADLHAALALSAYQRGDYEEMAAFAGKAVREDEAANVVRGAAAAMLAVTDRFAGRPESSERMADAAVAAVRDATDAELAAEGELLAAVPWGLLAVERIREAAEVGHRAAAAVGAAGNTAGLVPLVVGEALAAGLLGRIDVAAAAADRAEITARLTHSDQSLQWALWMRAWVVLEGGELEAARALAFESVSLAARLEDSALLKIADAVLGAVLLAAGDPDRARPLLAAYDVEPSWVCRWAPLLVEAQLALGDRDAAGLTAGRARALAKATGLAGAASGAERAAAIVALDAGRTDETIQRVQAAVACAESVGAALDAARAHLIAGRALAEQDKAAAVERLTLARNLANDGGARRTASEATRQLRRLGARIGRGGARSGASSGAASLSRRELEVAQLVTEGLTNREIAARLFLSEKTVESHLSKAFVKLDVTARAALAATITADPNVGH
jgi:DNA-binding NarL/FixJ family response regulator